MPGGGPGYSKPLPEKGNVELGLEIVLRTVATTVIVVLFGSLTFNSTIPSSARTFVGTIGFLLFAVFAVHTIACYREVWRRCQAANRA